MRNRDFDVVHAIVENAMMELDGAMSETDYLIWLRIMLAETA